MRLALISLLMIPLTLGCGGGGDEKPAAAADADSDAFEGASIECQDLCARRARLETSEALWQFFAAERRPDPDCEDLSESATCAACNQEMVDLLASRHSVLHDCACIFYEDCGYSRYESAERMAGLSQEQFREWILDYWGGYSVLEELCTFECEG